MSNSTEYRGFRFISLVTDEGPRFYVVHIASQFVIGVTETEDEARTVVDDHLK